MSIAPVPRLLALLGIAVAGLGVAADMLQFTPDAALHGPFHIDALLGSAPVWRIWAGGLVGIFAFVLAGVGVWCATLGLAGAPRRARAFLVSGLVSYACGAA